uniref:Uncharacterized protein n=1 Tax=Rhizophora mucronata TaxID=61149 RepID=A0A2P2NEW2_RHIMU
MTATRRRVIKGIRRMRRRR